MHMVRNRHLGQALIVCLAFIWVVNIGALFKIPHWPFAWPFNLIAISLSLLLLFRGGYSSMKDFLNS